MKARMLGFKYFEGQIDGKHMSSGRAFIEIPLDTARNAPGASFARGVCVEELNKIPIGILRQFEEYPFPCDVEIETVRVGDGRGKSREAVVNIVPISAGKPKP